MRRKYTEVTRELRKELKKRTEALALSGGVKDTEGLDEERRSDQRGKDRNDGDLIRDDPRQHPF